MVLDHEIEEQPIELGARGCLETAHLFGREHTRHERVAARVVRVRIGHETRTGRARVASDEDERRRVGDAMGAKYVWDGDPAIGLTYRAWCYEVPAVAVEL